MKRLPSIVCLLALWAGSAPAQAPASPPASSSDRTGASRDGAAAPFQVLVQKRIEIPVAGATAAYSLDSTVAEAAASDGVVVIEGRGPGAANVIVITSAGAQTIAVVVPQPPPSYPPGFIPPQAQGAVSERGAYEIRYSSDPSQLTNSVEFMRREGDSFTRLQLTNASLLSNNSNQPAIGFPLASYEISRPHYDVTFVDQQVSDTPLTLDGYLVRGLHVREGQWQFHGGFTSVAIFQGLFLSTDPEYLAGLSRSLTLGPGTLEAGFYYFQNPRKDLFLSSNGGTGSLAYRLRHKDTAKLVTELGVSHGGLAVAARGSYDDKKSHVMGNFRIVPQDFASLAVNNLHGTFADLSASRDFSPRFFATFNLDQADFNLPALKQNSFVSGSTFNYKLTRSFTLTSGWSYSSFQSLVPATASISSLNLPVGFDYATRHVGGGFQYQRTDNFDGTGGNDYAVNVRGTAGRFLMSAFYRHDVQVPTLAAVFAQLPGLEDLLTRAGIVVTTPEELAELLTNSALLASLGFSAPLSVNLAPVRNDLSATLSWIGRSASHPQVSLSYFDSNTELIQGQFRFASTSVSYSQRLRGPDDLVASASLLRTDTGQGPAVTRPVFSISLRHRFSSAPGFLLPGRHGSIEGHVFRDDQASARYLRGETGLAGVEVRLDGDRVTRTDAQGHYSFHHVPFGAHTIEAKFESGEPFFHTTDSPAVTEMNSTVDFGISFAKGQLFGFVLNDAGAGIGGATVRLEGAHGPRLTQTTMDGKFTFLGLEPGPYTVRTDPATYPAGYSLENLEPQQATVGIGRAERVEITVKAMRAISGKVTVYDKTVLKPVPLAQVVVRLKELSLETRTGSNGAYVFRNLPAGTYTLAVTYADREVTRKVTVPAGPASLRDVDLDAGPK
jgi:hypothetical protein